jgi:hypothetical protein
MCTVSGTSLKELVIPKKQYEVAKKWFQEGDWVIGGLLFFPALRAVV